MLAMAILTVLLFSAITEPSVGSDVVSAASTETSLEMHQSGELHSMRRLMIVPCQDDFQYAPSVARIHWIQSVQWRLAGPIDESEDSSFFLYFLYTSFERGDNLSPPGLLTIWTESHIDTLQLLGAFVQTLSYDEVYDEVFVLLLLVQHGVDFE
ncbi:hypothetical protein BSLG_010271 [Batrachochytrium salamandrivorans]|nr:hypothetical protein BSLG_010271 [Batrachochytrium salamandrivorans]